jgi:hypothetical protein
MAVKKTYYMTLVASIAGFLGGIISNQCFTLTAAFAQKQIKTQSLIIAKEIRLVDDKGNVLAFMAVSKDKQRQPKVDFRLTSAKSAIWLTAENAGSSMTIARASAGQGLNNTVRISAQKDSARLTLSQNKESIFQADNVELIASSKQTNIRLRDNKGKTRAIVGNVSLGSKKGVRQKYSVSSMALLDEKGKFLWSAPPRK